MKRVLLFLAMVLFPTLCFGQQTTVTATVVDHQGHPYASGSGSASIACPGNQAPEFNGFSLARTITIVALDGNGTFTIVLWDVNLITPLGCSWNFGITAANGYTSFTAPNIGASGSATPITGSSTVNLSAPINAYAVPIPQSGGGGGSGSVSSVGGLPPLFSVNNPTSTVTFSLLSAPQNTIFGNCTGSTGTPSYCAITAAMLQSSGIISGSIAANQVAFGSALNTIQGTNTLTYTSGQLGLTATAVGVTPLSVGSFSSSQTAALVDIHNQGTGAGVSPLTARGIGIGSFTPTGGTSIAYFEEESYALAPYGLAIGNRQANVSKGGIDSILVFGVNDSGLAQFGAGGAVGDSNNNYWYFTSDTLSGLTLGGSTLAPNVTKNSFSIEGIPGQTGNLQQWENSAATINGYVTPTGQASMNGGYVAPTDLVHAGFWDCIGNTTVAAIPVNSFGFTCPNSASFTSWWIQPSATAPAATCIFTLAAAASNVTAQTCTGVTGTGNVVQATSPTLVTPILGVAAATSLTATGVVSGATFTTATNCAAAGTAASPSVASCGSAAAGHFSCATNATGATCQVNTSAVTANSEIFVEESDNTNTGTLLSVTCNTSTNVNPTDRLLASWVASTSFTINVGTITTNPACFSYHIIN